MSLSRCSAPNESRCCSCVCRSLPHRPRPRPTPPLHQRGNPARHRFHHLLHIGGFRCPQREELRFAAVLRRINPVQKERVEMDVCNLRRIQTSARTSRRRIAPSRSRSRPPGSEDPHGRRRRECHGAPAEFRSDAPSCLHSQPLIFGKPTAFTSAEVDWIFRMSLKNYRQRQVKSTRTLGFPTRNVMKPSWSSR